MACEGLASSAWLVTRHMQHLHGVQSKIPHCMLDSACTLVWNVSCMWWLLQLVWGRHCATWVLEQALYTVQSQHLAFGLEGLWVPCILDSTPALAGLELCCMQQQL